MLACGSCGTLPTTALSSATVLPSTAADATRHSPEMSKGTECGMTPRTASSRLDLPAPEAPSSKTCSPGYTVRLIFSSNTRPLRGSTAVNSRSWISGSVIGAFRWHSYRQRRLL